MTLAYLPRLWCISLAAFFLVHAMLGGGVAVLARRAVRMADGMPARWAARWLLVLRLLPVAGAVLVVIAICVPSYLWLEPETDAERVGYVCLAAALTGLGLWCVALVKAVRAAVNSQLFLRGCKRAGSPVHLEDEAEVWIIDSQAPLVGIGGIMRPRLFVSRGVMGALSDEQLAAALGHERAHWAAHDNLKRLLILMAPAIAPFGSGNRTIERGWQKFTEWSADDWAVGGDVRRRCALAGALVRVARMGGGAHEQMPALPLLGDAGQLAERVDRLLRGQPARAASANGWRRLAIAAAGLAAAALLAAMARPATIQSVHAALEHLVG